MFHQSSSKSLSKKEMKHLTMGHSQPRKPSIPRRCQICGDKAKIINYGALSCQPCKTFFRRNGLHPESVHPCSYSGTCNITIETRRACCSCRLGKCFSVGMSSDFIRKEEKKSNRYSSVLKYKKNIQALHTLTKASDQSHPKRYLLFDYQKTIVFKVVRALEVYSAIPKVREIIEDELALIFELPFDASSATQCVHHIFISIQSFINSVPDFRIMDIGEQSSLFQRNFSGVAIFYSALVFRQTGIIHRPDIITIFNSIFGSEMMLELVKISKQFKMDLITIKLMLLILIFSSNFSIVDYEAHIDYDVLMAGTFRLFGSQNAYVIILWKHMVCQYGYYKAALYFTQLIQFSINLIKSSDITCTSKRIYDQLVNEFHRNNKQWLVMNQHERVRLWGNI